MILTRRIDDLCKLGEYMLSSDPAWLEAKEKAGRDNSWFIPEFVDLAVTNIAKSFLQKEILEKWIVGYPLKTEQVHSKKVGIVMAGNIPLVGFHDFLCVFISGHRAVIKASSKDEALIRQITAAMNELDPSTKDLVHFSDMLKHCDAYIATGSNNSAGHFEYYFKKYPHIIRRNRTSVALLSGNETMLELEGLADDVFLYFGLGCRNVTKVYVPKGYDFIPMLKAFGKYDHFADYHKYKNNYDYDLAIQILNKKFYMTCASLVLVEDPSPFSPIGQLNYEFYDSRENVLASLNGNPAIQAVAGRDLIPFGQTQNPAINDYADGVDTMQFLTRL